MPKRINKLTALKTQKLQKPGWYPDGLGLYLQVSPSRSKSWVYRYEMSGKERRHGLGRYGANGGDGVSLDSARRKAGECREMRKQGIDPIDSKKLVDAQRALQRVKGITFRACAEAYIQAHEVSWKNYKHRNQWRNTLSTYAFPHIGDLAVKDVDVGIVLKVLEPIWNVKSETASRVRQRIESILDWAAVRKYREGDNPVRWKGHLELLLPNKNKVSKVQHFKAMPYKDVPDYFNALRAKDSIAARSLAFIILTACRSGEGRGARVEEIDLDKQVWELPADLMKADRPHRIPLSEEAMCILNESRHVEKDGFVFPGLRSHSPITEAAVRKLLKQDDSEATIHGFRSSFRDWCAEQTNYPRELPEFALAHSAQNQTEAAYMRSDFFEKRRKLMADWAEYCINGDQRADVLPILQNSG